MTADNAEKLITVVGGAGFIGRHVVRNLAKRGYRIRVACRRPDLAGHVQPLGSPGQIMPVQANLRFPESIAAACDGAYAVINATGIDHASGAQSFDAVLNFGAEAVAKAARAANAGVFIMVSGMGAGANAESEAARFKAKGEVASAKAFPGAIIVRPSIVFGPDDRFFNKLAGMARFAPALPLFGGGHTRYQPVFVGDVAEAVAVLVDRGEASGKIYELGGDETATMEELTKFVLETTRRKRLLVPVPWPIAALMGTILGYLPGKPLTANQVALLKTDNVVSASAKSTGLDLVGLGITPRSFRSIVPTYLYRFRKEGQFTAASGTPE